MTAVILSPTYRSIPRIQYETMELLQENLGPQVSRGVIERAVCEISQRMGRLELELRGGNTGHVRTIALRLGPIGRQIGLVGFADAAADLVACIDRQDIPATHAVAARLIRLGERSVLQAEQFARADGA